jgi:hypothetical protein
MHELSPVIHSFAYALDYLREQVADVNDADMAQQPPGVVNHPAWVIGHLTITCQMLAGDVAGMPAWLPDDWRERYGTGSKPLPDAARYEPKERLLTMLREAQERTTRAVERLEGSRLDEPFPHAELLYVFPTIRHAIVQVLVGHASMHVGQVAVWRKAMRLPPMRRAFE